MKFSFFIVSKYNIKYVFKLILSVQLSGIKYIHSDVHFQTFSSLQIEIL